MNWNEYRKETLSNVSDFAKAAPETMKALMAVSAASQKTGHLDEKTRELISVAVAITTRCDGCIAAHAEAAVKAGVTEEELTEALSVAINLNTGAAMVYSSRALAAVRQVQK